MGLIPAAEDAGISVRTASKWLKRYKALGEAGLADRSSRPHKTRSTMDEEMRGRIDCAAPACRCAQLHASWGVAPRPSRFLATLGLSSLKALEPAKPIMRYERSVPGEMLHLDTKKLGRIVRPSHRVTGDRRDSVDGAGWEVAHVAIDDYSRIGFVQVHADEKKTSAAAFLRAAVAHYAALGVRIQRVLTDNGSAYRLQAFARACQAMGIKHSTLSPANQWQGRALHPDLLREWAYARTYDNSAERTAWLPASGLLQQQAAPFSPRLLASCFSPRRE